MKPGSASLPMFGVKLALLQSETGKIIPERLGADESGVLAISQPWPGIARTIYKDHGRYLQTYMDVYKGFYFTGDGARRDRDGYYWITGRVDDVINKAGHRLGTAEIESALVSLISCSEAAVVAVPTNSAKGEAIVAFCTLKNGYTEDPDIIHGLKEAVKRAIGKIADPDAIVITHALPKTRSGKIMRRRTLTLMVSLF
jgi:acetyl-CoA synthetase